MIFGTGLDIIEINRIKKSLEKYSTRFENKVFTDREIDYCQSQADPGKHFAARFAVKEAVSKSLGTGIARDVGDAGAVIAHPREDANGRVQDQSPLVGTHVSAVLLG